MGAILLTLFLVHFGYYAFCDLIEAIKELFEK